MTYVWLVLGFVLLIKGADFFVEGSAGIAKILKVPSVIIGLTIVAMGTSAPEASVSITAGLAGSNELALSNIIGSNIFNLLMVVGICAFVRSISGEKSIINRDLPFNLIISVLLLILLLDGKIGRIDGAILLLVMVGYMVLLIKNAMKNREDGGNTHKIPLWQCILYIIGGLAAVIFGGDLVVNSASEIAVSLGMSQNLVGLTIVAIGTSLPELVTSVIATGKGEHELALGNAVGSCVFNILFILGMSSVLSPIGVNSENLIDISILIFVSLFFVIMCKKKENLRRLDGAVCILMYVVYTAYIIFRNYK